MLFPGDPDILFWEYLFRNFSILFLQCVVCMLKRKLRTIFIDYWFYVRKGLNVLRFPLEQKRWITDIYDYMTCIISGIYTFGLLEHWFIHLSIHKSKHLLLYNRQIRWSTSACKQAMELTEQYYCYSVAAGNLLKWRLVSTPSGTSPPPPVRVSIEQYCCYSAAAGNLLKWRLVSTPRGHLHQ
jgi:hypothetical protein